MIRYFFLIKYLPTSCNHSLLAGRCINVLHLFRRVQSLESVGVTFPDWSEASIGASIGFVSLDVSPLERLMKHDYFSMMTEEELFDLSAIQCVPEDAGEVRFIRNQTISKAFVGEKRRRLARAKRRAEARGEVFCPEKTQINDREVGFFHSIYMSSRSSQQQFVLNIQRESTETINPKGYNSYGIASNQEKRGTVPVL